MDKKKFCDRIFSSNKNKGIGLVGAFSGGPPIQKSAEERLRDAKDTAQSLCSIQVVYVDDTDILYIDELVRNKFHLRSRELENAYVTFNKRYKRLVSEPLNIIDYRYLMGEIYSLLDRIEYLETNNDAEKYVQETDYLLREYREIGPLKKKISLKSRESNNIPVQRRLNRSADSENYDYRKNIIRTYIKIVQKYFNLCIVEDSTISEDYCETCGMEREFEPTEAGNSYCSVCKCEQPALTMTQFQKDNEEDMNNGNAVEGAVYHGGNKNQIQQTLIPHHIIESVEECLITLGSPPSREIRARELAPDGTKEGTDQNIMIQAIRASGNEVYCKDHMQFCNLIWGWQTRDRDSYNSESDDGDDN